jgi:5-carboxymethyl-2-hydroxymuconate isomerase
MRILSEHREPKDLPSHLTPLESALTTTSSHNLFIIRTYAARLDMWETKDLQAQEFIDNSFVINTYERPSEVRETQGL